MANQSNGASVLHEAPHDHLAERTQRGCWGRDTKFHKAFMPRARIKLRHHVEDMASIQNRFVPFSSHMHSQRARARRNVKFANYTIYSTATLLMLVTLFNGTMNFFEHSDEVFGYADKILTILFVGMIATRSKLKMVEKASLYSIAGDMLNSMGTYLLETAGMYQSFDSPHEAMPLFWTQFEALTQAIGVEKRGIEIQGHGQVAGMQMRLIYAMERSCPGYSAEIRAAFMAKLDKASDTDGAEQTMPSDTGNVMLPPGLKNLPQGKMLETVVGHDSDDKGLSSAAITIISEHGDCNRSVAGVPGDQRAERVNKVV